MKNCICCLEATVYHYGINMAAWNVGRVCLGTLYCQKYSLTHSNDLIQVFQSLPWPQVCQSKHLGMQTVFTNICERMSRSQELSEFQRGTVIGCHISNKSSCEISLLLNEFPWQTFGVPKVLHRKLHRTPLGWIRVETESQFFPSNISVWPHKCTSGRMVKNSHKHS